MANAERALVVRDSRAFGKRLRAASLLPVFQREPPPLATRHLCRGKIQAGAGVVELPEQRTSATLPGRRGVGGIRGVPGAKKRSLPQRGGEQKPVPTADRIVLAITVGAHPDGHVRQAADMAARSSTTTDRTSFVPELPNSPASEAGTRSGGASSGASA